MLLRFIFCFYILFSLDEFFLILFITPVYNFIINRLADESAVLKPLSLHNNRYWSDLPAFNTLAASYRITAKWPEDFLLIVACFNIPPERVQKQRNMFHPVILPYRYAKHNTYKAVSIQIIGTIMCGMVKEFWNILKATLAVIFIKWE